MNISRVILSVGVGLATSLGSYGQKPSLESLVEYEMPKVESTQILVDDNPLTYREGLTFPVPCKTQGEHHEQESHTYFVESFFIDAVAPLVIIGRLTERKDRVEEYIAQDCNEAGIHAVIVYRENAKDDFHPETIWNTIEEYATAIRITANQYTSNPNVTDIGVFGAAMGAMATYNAMAVDQQIKAGVFAFLPADASEFFGSSDQEYIREFREEFIEKEIISEQRYQELCSENMPYEPKDIAKYLKGRPSLFLVFEDIKVISNEEQRALKELCEGQEVAIKVGLNPDKVDSWGSYAIPIFGQIKMGKVFSALKKYENTIRPGFLEFYKNNLEFTSQDLLLQSAQEEYAPLEKSYVQD